MLFKKNREVFTTSYMKIVVKFLYDAYSYRIIIFLLPPYLAHLIAINLQIYYNEYMRALRERMEHEENLVLNVENKKSYDKALIASNLIIVVCGGINILNTLVFIMQTKYLGTNAFTRIWSIIDFIIIITNNVTWVNAYYKIGTAKMRLIECLLILCIWFKSMYYMRLIQKIAPLVESIFVILDDMMYFLLVFGIGIFAFAEAFFILGQNQVLLQKEDYFGKEIPGVKEEDVTKPSYFKFPGAFFHAYMSALG